MASYFFSLPDVYFGENAIQTLRRLNHKKVAIVTDSFMVSSGKTRDLINEMPQACVSIFSEVKPDPSVEILHAGAAQFKSFKPQVIIALGGGSALDAAKGIKVTLEEFLPGHAIELSPFRPPAVPVPKSPPTPSSPIRKTAENIR